MKKWRVVVYQKHTGIVDGDGNSICSMVPNSEKDAKLIVKAVNKLFESKRQK